MAPATKLPDDAAAARYRPDTFQLTPDGIPIRRLPAPLARRFQQICAAVIAEAFAGEEVVQIEYASLFFLADVPGIDQARLAEALGIDRNNAGQAVERLEGKGLLERRINGEDRRARQLYLTAKGRRIIDRMRPRARAANDRILSPLAPGERATFIDLLVRVIEGNASYARPGAGRRKRGSLQSTKL
jgi:DNA-binding MarR family transcriptional regulator